MQLCIDGCQPEMSGENFLLPESSILESRNLLKHQQKMDPQRIFTDDEKDSDSESKAVPVSKPEPQEEDESPTPWESMQARRRDPSEPMDEIEARLAKVFKNHHTRNAPSATQKLEMTSSGSICKKCLLFKGACQAIGRHVEDT